MLQKSLIMQVVCHSFCSSVCL